MVPVSAIYEPGGALAGLLRVSMAGRLAGIQIYLLSRRLNPRQRIKPYKDAHNIISFRYLRGGAEKMTIPVLNSAGHIPLAQNSNRE